MNIRILASAIVLAAAVVAAAADRFTAPVDSLVKSIESHMSDPVVGLWRINGDGALIAITPVEGHNGRFDITLVDSPDMSIAPLTPCGTLRRTTSAGDYDARMIIDPAKSDLKRRTLDCVFRLNDDNSLAFKFYRRNRTVSLWRWIPYLFRVTVIESSTRPDYLDGAVRVLPQSPQSRVTVL